MATAASPAGSATSGRESLVDRWGERWCMVVPFRSMEKCVGAASSETAPSAGWVSAADDEVAAGGARPRRALADVRVRVLVDDERERPREIERRDDDLVGRVPGRIRVEVAPDLVLAGRRPRRVVAEVAEVGGAGAEVDVGRVVAAGREPLGGDADV